MADQSIQDITTQVEDELLNIIINNLDTEKMTVEEAQALAKEFLSMLPLEDKQDLLDKLYKFGTGYAEAKSLYLKYAKPIEEEARKKKLALMSEHIKNGQIDHALAVAKGGIKNASA